MKRTIEEHPTASEWLDPRSASDFNPRWFPKADGRDAPAPNSSDRCDPIRLQFLAAYYALNRSYARLQEVRRSRKKKPGTAQAGEVMALKQIEAVLRRRDALEDRYACLGVVAEPVMEKGFTVDVTFSFGAERRETDFSGGLYSSAYITIPLPAGAKLE